jgi:UDP-N-acetylmuramoylalanine--D-glutamate ligase
LDAYAEAKMNLVRYQDAQGTVLINQGDEVACGYVNAAGAGQRMKECIFEPYFAPFMQVPGGHNRRNAAQAVAACRAIGLSDELIAQGLRAFHGLPHRLEFVAEVKGVRYYNDSKSTVPSSTQIAVEAFDVPVIALVGGQGKGMSFAEMGLLLGRICRSVICYGSAGPEIYKEAISGNGSAHVELVSGLTPAVKRARELAQPGEVVVLSPACTSYDEFSNYEERGETFRRLVAAPVC